MVVNAPHSARFASLACEVDRLYYKPLTDLHAIGHVRTI